jgi:ribosomal protein S18 acetylase RimI-like enzyme
MTTLAPMRAEAYPAFFDEAVAFYAAENIAVGRWQAEEALDLSRLETESLLSQGLETPDHHIFEIFSAVNQEPVGYVWVAAMPRGAAKVAFVVQLKIHPESQRQGHGRAALGLVEKHARQLGLSGMELQVFAHNPNAQALYESVGYKVSSFYMTKPFADNAPNKSFEADGFAAA